MVILKFSATIEIGSEYDESEFNPEKVEAERKNKYVVFKEKLQERLDYLLEDEFDYVNVKNIKILWNENKSKT